MITLTIDRPNFMTLTIQSCDLETFSNFCTMEQQLKNVVSVNVHCIMVLKKKILELRRICIFADSFSGCGFSFLVSAGNKSVQFYE